MYHCTMLEVGKEEDVQMMVVKDKVVVQLEAEKKMILFHCTCMVVHLHFVLYRYAKNYCLQRLAI